MKNFAYDQETYNIVKNEISDILGYEASGDLIHSMQEKLEYGYTHEAIKREIASRK